MLYAFIQSSNYSNVYNILQPEALDLESYRKYIEQNHVSDERNNFRIFLSFFLSIDLFSKMTLNSQIRFRFEIVFFSLLFFK